MQKNFVPNFSKIRPDYDHFRKKSFSGLGHHFFRIFAKKKLLHIRRVLTVGSTLSKIWTHETSISPRSGQKKSCMFFMQERAKLLFETLRPLSILLSCLGRGQFFTSPILLQKERATREARAQKQQTCIEQCVAHACVFLHISEGAGRA